MVDDALGERFAIDPSSSMLIVLRGMDSVAKVAPATEKLRTLDGIDSVGSAQPLPGGPQRIEAPLSIQPSSDQARELVEMARSLDWGARVLVTGPSAELVDQRSSLADHLPLAVGIVVATTVIAILLMTGSLVLPLLALLMNTLTVCASFGILVLVFQDGRLRVDPRLLQRRRDRLLCPDPAVRDHLRALDRLRRISPERHRRGPPSASPTAPRRSPWGWSEAGIITGAALLFAIAMGSFGLLPAWSSSRRWPSAPRWRC